MTNFVFITPLGVLYTCSNKIKGSFNIIFRRKVDVEQIKCRVLQGGAHYVPNIHFIGEKGKVHREFWKRTRHNNPYSF